MDNSLLVDTARPTRVIVATTVLGFCYGQLEVRAAPWCGHTDVLLGCVTLATRGQEATELRYALQHITAQMMAAWL
jgi:hypothetical protein